MRSMLLLVALSAAAGVAFACSSDYGASPPDGVDASDERAQDLADASDARSDAADAGGFCASRTGDTYCEDFDTLLDVTTLVPEHSAKSTVGLTQGFFVSPTRALAFLVDKDESPSFAVFKHVVAGDRPVRLELDLRFGALADTPQTLQSITLTRKDGAVSTGRSCLAGDGGVPSCTSFVAVCLFGTEAGATCTTTALPAAKTFFAAGRWFHVALEARFGQAGHVELEVDREVVLDLDTVTNQGPVPADAPTVVTVGAGALQGAAGVYLITDNVVVTQP